MSDAARIAAGLSDEVKQRLLAMPYTCRGFWKAIDVELVGLGLTPPEAKDVSLEQETRFLVEATELGLAVRAECIKQEIEQ